MKPTLTIETKRRVDDSTGREITSFTPVFKPDCTASGDLRFAMFEAWSDDTETKIASQRANALNNALQCLSNFSTKTSLI